jgi:signal transduction histidine kinase
MEIKNLTCLDSNPDFLGLFDFSIAPSFLYYTYIPIMLLLLVLGLWVYRSGRDRISNQLFFAFTGVYVLDLINEIILWTASSVSVVHFGWQMVSMLKFFVALVFFSFAATFIQKKDLSKTLKKILLLVSLPVFILTPTTLNIGYFDYGYCEGVSTLLKYYVYLFELFCLVYIGFLGFNSVNREKKGVKIFTIFSSIMLLALLLVNVMGDQTLFYEIDIIGPLGVLLFVAGLTFSIVRYGIFNIKLLGAHVLVSALAFLSFAALFIRNIGNIKIILVINLTVTLIIGYFLVRSIKQIDTQRELLETSNQNQQSLLHFITHQIKGYMTKSRNIFDGMLAGDYGNITDDLKKIAQHGFDSDTQGVETVQAILKATDLKSGRILFDKGRVDISSLVAQVSEKAKESATKKGLEFTFDIEPNLEAIVDVMQMKELFMNLINNAILYTKKGEIKITLRAKDSDIRFSVIDTGFGLTIEDKENLFTEGGKSKEALSINVESTGYGLFISKKIVEEHNGKIGAHSPGRNKGSEFFVILPRIQ